jgi:ankyrin repeat protein
MPSVHDIFRAASRGDPEAAAEILSDDPSLAATTDISGNTPLHVAALADWSPSTGHLETARLLIAYGADVNAQGYEDNMEGATPLILAAFANNLDMVKLLLEHSADPDAKSEKNQTALSVASALNFHDISAVLLQHGARPDIHAAAKLGLLVAVDRHLRQAPHLLEEESEFDGLTPLEAAAWHGQQPAAELLIEYGANVTIFVAAALGMTDWLKNFLDARPALVHSRPGSKEFKKTGAQALIWAARNDRVDAVRLLLDYDADVSAVDWWGDDALHHAAMRGATGSIRLLAEAGADIHRANRGFEPIHRAQAGQHDAAVELLRSLGAG